MSSLETLGWMYLWGVAGSLTVTLIIVIVEAALKRTRRVEGIVTTTWLCREVIDAVTWPLMSVVYLYRLARLIAWLIKRKVTRNDVDL